MDELAPNTSAFSEYELFEPEQDGMSAREAQNQQFQKGKVTNPTFDYPKLDAAQLAARHTAFTDAIESADEEAEKARLIGRRKGVDIAMASLNLATAPTHEARWHAGNDFTDKSQERYGQTSPNLFWPVIASRIDAAREFIPGNTHAQMVQERALQLLPEVPAGTEYEPLISHELLEAIRPEVEAHLAPILASLPHDGDFTSDEIVGFATISLENSGLATNGWTVVQNSETRLFSVRYSKKQIVIPNPPPKDNVPYTKSAQDIKRLFAHEIGIHASREKPMGGEFEEGMGLLMECVVTGQTDGIAIQRAENRYMHVGLAEGIDGVLRNARQVFEISWRLEAMRLAKDGIITPQIEAAAKESMQSHIDNIFRGTDHRLPGVHYNKAKIYLEGIYEAVAYADRYKDQQGWLKELLKNGPGKK